MELLHVGLRLFLRAGPDDGAAAREIIGSMPAGQSAKVKVTLEVERVPNLETAQIWGTLPGATDAEPNMLV